MGTYTRISRDLAAEAKDSSAEEANEHQGIDEQQERSHHEPSEQMHIQHIVGTQVQKETHGDEPGTEVLDPQPCTQGFFRSSPGIENLR